MLARRWAQNGRSSSWQEVATKMGQDSAKLAILGSTWEVLGACWEHFGSILAHGLDSRKPTKTWGKQCFWVFWGAWNGAVIRKSGMGAMLVDLVAPFGVLRAML